MRSTRVVCVLATLALAGCGGGGGGTPAVPAPTLASPVLVEGAVQKGPFIVGSTVLINRLDSRGRSTPSTLVAEIEDSVGSFSFETDRARAGPDRRDGVLLQRADRTNLRRQVDAERRCTRSATIRARSHT